MPSPTGNTTLTCASLGGCILINNLTDNSTVDLKTQNITLRIKGLQNIQYVTSIDAVSVKTFYDAEWDSRVAEINQDSNVVLKTTSGTLTITSINFDSSTINFQKNKLTITVTN